MAASDDLFREDGSADMEEVRKRIKRMQQSVGAGPAGVSQSARDLLGVTKPLSGAVPYIGSR